MKVLTCIFIFSLLIGSNCLLANPKVFVFTDINIGGGDPDDRQSLVHLLWYADELDMLEIVPDRWNKEDLEACQMAVALYRADFERFNFFANGYPKPEEIDQL